MWFAICDPDGTLVSSGTVVDDAAVAARGLLKIALDGPPGDREWDAAARAFVTPPPAPVTNVTKLAFIQRFTPSEFMSIRASADPGVQFQLYQIEQSVTVDLTSPAVTDGLDYLVSQGLITRARADQIGSI